ncbi:flagellar export chaperone FliS [Pseudogulbenkiania sp. MAI-1]|uniref:flagellar export chaperone FliS n=1 Tax=Pseudogulbenkiania sp. MAI-1 TaxID=990370 RepID=UPI00045E5F03|nr:flagellar export chaperone FliS [Pseudogulbenkiania sp. MAI-1]
MNRRALQQLNKAYLDDALQVAVYGASPVGIIVLLYEGAIKALQQAERAMAEQRFDVKSAMISKAIDILDGLREVLDFQQGGDISQNLSDLYLYMKSRLSVANLKNDPAILVEVQGLLEEILSAWKQVEKTAAMVPQKAVNAGF